MIGSSKRKILGLLLELEGRGVLLTKPSVIRYYLMAYEPDRYFSFESARRNVRRCLNTLANDGYLNKYKLNNRRTFYSLTPDGVKLAKGVRV